MLDVNSAFTEMNLASTSGGRVDQLSQMPAIPPANGTMVSILVVASYWCACLLDLIVVPSVKVRWLVKHHRNFGLYVASCTLLLVFLPTLINVITECVQ